MPTKWTFSQNCVFLGYSSSHRGYKCLHVPSSHLYISQHVIFDENLFPFASNIFFLPLLDRMPFIHMCPHLFLPRHLIRLHYPWYLIILHMVLSLVSHHLHQCLLMCLTLFLHMLTPLPHHLLPPPLPPVCTHPMVTWLQHNITKPKVFFDGTVKYPLFTALTVMCSSKNVCVQARMLNQIVFFLNC